MVVTIKEIKQIENFTGFFVEYLQEVHQLTEEEKITQIVNDLQEKFNNNKRIIFVAYKEEKIIGFISGNNESSIFETTGFYIRKEDDIENCGFQLITAIATKAFELGMIYFRQSISMPAHFELSMEEQLKANGFTLFPRVTMIKELSVDEKPIIDLSEDYFFEPFSIERVDELFLLMKEANPPSHSDSQIYPEMLDPEQSKKIFGQFSQNFTSINGDLNPQIIYENKMVGLSFVLAQNTETVFILELCVSPTHQRKGLGKALMNKIITECAKKGYKRLGLAVTTDNIGACKLYEKIGFKIIKNHLSIIKAKK